MTTLGRQRSWKLFAGVVCVVVIFLSSFMVKPVRAMISNIQMGTILFRFVDEVVLPYPAGQYYISLSWKHKDDLGRIYNDPGNLVHAGKLLQIVQVFIPNMEAMLDEKGDTVQITKEQMDLIQTEMDWLSSVAGPELQQDLEKELQRLPLENFIGMTMNEAVEYVNWTWTPDTVWEPAELETSFENPKCAVGLDADCLAPPFFVPTSNGQLAFYVYKNIYFEYPSNWQVKKTLGNTDELIIAPTPTSPEGSNFSKIALMFLPDLVIENWEQVLNEPSPVWQRPNTEWRSLIYLDEFQGFENVWRFSEDPVSDLEFFFYNESHQLGFGAVAIPVDNMAADLIASQEVSREMFPDLYELVESIRIAEQ